MASARVTALRMLTQRRLTPAGVYFKHGFSWSSVNYAPLVTLGVMAAVTIWYFVSAKNTFKGPVRTIDLPDSEVPASHDIAPAGAG